LQVVGAEVSYAEITSPYGHDAFLLEPERQHAYIAPFLARARSEDR
jgi:homoserine acetyltransferase